MIRRALLIAACALSVMLFALPSFAHKPSDAYLTLLVEGARIDARLDLAIRDLDQAIFLDADGDGSVTWKELQGKHDAIDAFVQKRLTLTALGASCPLQPLSQKVIEHADGGYVVLELRGTCPTVPAALALHYDGFFDQDPHHRLLVKVDASGSTRTAALSASRRDESLRLDGTGRLREFVTMVREGIGHVLSGYDHLAFLLALLLPCVLHRRDGVIEPVASMRVTLKDVLAVVTAFTAAHSITLAIGAFSIATPPPRLVESAIALSVILAAADNLYDFLRFDRWAVPFVLGLVHGFGFSSSLGELGVARSGLVVALLGFNVGVELGQLACVAVFVPLAFAARKNVAYRRYALGGGSIAIALLASVWFVERAFAVRILPG